MNIHIRQPVEFEKIIDDPHIHCIELTRHRMAVQQLLDSRDNDCSLMVRLKEYIQCFDSIVRKINPVKKLLKQPNFHWAIDNKSVQSSCWKFEAIVPRVVLAQLCQMESEKCIKEGQYVEAGKSLRLSIQYHHNALKVLGKWKWKLPTANHYILQKDWHVSRIHHFQSMQNLCMLCVGIQKETPAKALYTVAQRAVKESTHAICAWPEAPSTLALSQAMQHYFSAHILWNREEYGGSIHRLETWLHDTSMDTFDFKHLREELDKVAFLISERKQVNNGAYFDVIAPVTPLPTPEELIHTTSTDAPHPQSTHSTPMEPSPDEARDSMPPSEAQ